MLFSVVQERKNEKAKAVLSVVPTKWIQGKNIYWPPMNVVETLQRDPDSAPDFKTWKQYSYDAIIGGRNTFEDADKLLDEYLNLTDPGKENSSRRVTRSNPMCGKSGKFTSSTYCLTQPSRSNILTNSPQTPKTPSLAKRKRKINESASTPTNILSEVNHVVSASNYLSASLNEDSINTEIVYDGSNQMAFQLDGNGGLLNYVVVENQSDATLPADNTVADGTLDLTSIDTSFLNNLTSNRNVGNDSNNTLTNVLLRLEEKIDAQNVILGQIKEKVDVNTENIAKCIKFIINTEKFMQLLPKQAEHQQSSEISESNEDFSAFSGLKSATTQEEVIDLEWKLSNAEYKAKFIRYMKTIKKLDGRGQGAVIFRELFRSLVLPSAIMNYSWSGQSSSKDQNMQCFHTTFPSLIDFIHKVVRAGDSKFVLDQTIQLFKVFLRNKKTEAKRNIFRKTVERRSTYTRKTRPKDDHQRVDVSTYSEEQVLDGSNQDGESTIEAKDGSDNTGSHNLQPNRDDEHL